MDPNQFFLMAGGLLVVSLILLIGGISLYRGRQEAEDEKARTLNPGRPMLMEQPGADPPASEGSPAEEMPAAKPTPDAAPMLKGRPDGAHPAERKPIPERPSPVSAAPSEGGLEILRVYRDPIDGELSIQVMGQETEAIEAMGAARLSQLKRVIGEIADRVAQIPEPQPETAYTTRPGMAPGDSQEGGPEEPASDESGRTGSIRPETTFADSLPQQPEIRELLFPRRKPKAEESEPPEPPKSIAAQIDEIVQTLLPGSGLSGHQIHLAEVPGGGLLITHNGSRYEGIDEVEDPDVKALIKKAVGVWNERNKLG